MRSEAQKRADKKYRAKDPKRLKILSFNFTRKEAEELDKIITNSGMTKVDFLRKAVKCYQEGKFDD